ncbi:phosphatase PAP2 family protein [Parafrankia discariae]|uniref:phosphatase PAP2 family protein n=1 Tax=Parafrankia discariae TaxID=365528 RepID=UPI0003689F2A|nr:phosphatase PAP2 family protein [Parafrankia discariae]
MRSTSDRPAGPPAPERARTETVRYAVVGVAGILLTVLLGAVVFRSGTPLGLDAGWHRWVLAHRNPGMSDVVVAVTDTGAGACAYSLAALAGALAAPRWRRWWLGAVTGVAALLLGQLLRTSLAVIVGRARPPVADWITHPSGFAFPSGHTTTSALVAAGLAAVLYRRARRRSTRAAAVAVPGVWAFAVGLSRIYLGVHWPTDVFAGWLLATVLAVACLPSLGALLAWSGQIGHTRRGRGRGRG